MKNALVRGAGLLEAMISVVVLGLGSLALIRLELGSLQQAQRTRQNEAQLRDALTWQEEQRAKVQAVVVDGAGGFTLVELLVSLVVSSWVVLTAMGLYLNGVQQREYQNASNLLQENERYLREILTRGVHQAGFENWQEGGVLRSRQSTTQIDPQRAVTDLVAFNNAGLDTEPPWGVFDGSSSMALQAQNNAKNRYLNNDVLMLRFQGMNDLKGAADGSLINCVGLAEAATPSATAWRYRPWVAFGVVAGTGTGGEPELTCRYLHPGSGDTAENSQAQSAANWVARPLARGVEVFQLMLAVASGSDKTPLQWLTPYQVAQQGLWPALLAVRFGMVLRSPNRVFSAGLVGAGSNEAKTVGLLTPLGAAYTREESEDPGVRFTPPDDGRLRRMLVFTVALRNPLTPEPG